MAYDQAVADRVRDILKRRRGITERKMFGGLAFMLQDKMCCGVLERDLALRLGEAGAAAALAIRRTRPMDFTGRPLKTMVYMEPPGCCTETPLRAWVDRAIRLTRALT